LFLPSSSQTESPSLPSKLKLKTHALRGGATEEDSDGDGDEHKKGETDDDDIVMGGGEDNDIVMGGEGDNDGGGMDEVEGDDGPEKLSEKIGGGGSSSGDSNHSEKYAGRPVSDHHLFLTSF
jgi:hypothetical protein